jgi:hypothetical protein
MGPQVLAAFDLGFVLLDCSPPGQRVSRTKPLSVL